MNIKRFNYYIIGYLVFWAISVFIPDILFGDASSIFAKMMTIQVPVAEYGSIPINIHLSTFFEFIIPFIISPIFIFLIYREILSSPSTYKRIKCKVWTKYGIITAMLIFSLGGGFHYVGDALDTILPFDWIKICWLTGNINESVILYYFKFPAYFFDEVVSHKLEHLGLFIAYSGLALMQYWHPIEHDMEKIDFYGLVALGGAYGVATMIALAEGQATFEFLFISIGLLGFIVYQMKKLEINLKKMPFLTFFMFFLLMIVITTPIWGITTGIKPYYPFFYQLSEL
ncbi:MAG: hypothetical protein ACTSRG_17710 [Candidatus Helarchaeota archaeon]